MPLKDAGYKVLEQVKKLGSLLPSRGVSTRDERRVIRPWREDSYHAYPSVGLTPARVLALLHTADAGSPQMQFELFGEMLQKWPRLAAVEATRRLALTGLDWEIEPGDSTGQARAAAEYCRDTLASLGRFHDALDHLANAIGYGIAVAELVWDGGKLIDVVPVPYSRLISDVNEPWRLRVRTEEEQSTGVALDELPAKWIVHQPRVKPGRHFEGGLLRSSVLLYVAQNLSFKDWLIYSQIAGMPVRVGRFEPGTPESDKQQLLKMLEALGTDAVAILSKNIELQLLEARGGDKPYQPLQEHCNNEVTILWLGQHLTTDLRGEGSRGVGRTAKSAKLTKGSGFRVWRRLIAGGVALPSCGLVAYTVRHGRQTIVEKSTARRACRVAEARRAPVGAARHAHRLLRVARLAHTRGITAMTDGYASNPKLTETLISCLEAWKIPSLTDIQERAIAAGVALGSSAIVCAPTSSGKTLIGELALANALSNGIDALYLVSHKALAEQKFSDFGGHFSTPSWASTVTVGISTGDHEEGDVNCRLLVSTYEKALGLILAGRLKVAKTVIIADELQILGEEGRGASVETLCALLRQRQPHQFVGLTATVENPEDLAAWMNSKTVRSATRDVDLIQTIRYEGQLYTVRFGQEDGETTADSFGQADLHGVIRKVLQDGLGPVLIFTETRREASELASQYCEKCQRAADGLAISQQLELFTEPTESSQLLMSHAERRVTFHTADLTPDERSVIESGFAKASFDVCFATSTLAAGVNFPFRTVIITKLTYGYGDRQGKLFARSDFRNMSGRAGRLGHHDDGRVLLLPKNRAELQHANRLVSPENDRVVSQLVTLSMRRTVLSLVAARAVSSKDELTTFFENTFYWHTAEDNPKLLERIIALAIKAIDWLLENKFVEESHSTIQATPLGKSTSLSGLLPETAKRFVDLLAKFSKQMQENFGTYEVALIHWAATCPEFAGELPSRFLPWPSARIKPESSVFMQRVTHLAVWDRNDEKVTQCVHAMGLFIQGEAERKIRFPTGLSAGSVHRLSIDFGWVLDGLSCVSGAADLGCPQALTNQIAMLARRVHWGVPAEALDVLRIANRKSVPGFGRQRVMALIANGLVTVMDVIGAGRDQLVKLLGGEQRTDALVAALSDTFDGATVSFERTHLQLGQELGIKEKVAKCNDALGTEYDDAICQLLKEELNWSVDKLDDGKRQNVPDIQLVLGDTVLLIECKTVTKNPPLIAKEEAFAVLQKASDFDSHMKQVTLGKPDFDEHSKKKAAASPSVTLVRHGVFMEGLMRVLTGRLLASDFVAWLAEPGVTDLSRLPGTPTYAEPEAL